MFLPLAFGGGGGFSVDAVYKQSMIGCYSLCANQWMDLKKNKTNIVEKEERNKNYI